MLKELRKELSNKANPEKAKLLARFFKTGKGEYGQGDIFLGLMVPIQREISKKYKNLSINEIQELLESKIHEERLIALLILIEQYNKSSPEEKKKIHEFYLKAANKNQINNWDLVDLSCKHLVGNYLSDKPRDLLYKLAKSDNLWEKRIAIVSTCYFISKGELEDTFKISEILMKDKHDLIHKAVGWMLREAGKKKEQDLRNFLKKHKDHMPRTMLRYSIERLNDREKFL